MLQLQNRPINFILYLLIMDDIIFENAKIAATMKLKNSVTFVTFVTFFEFVV